MNLKITNAGSINNAGIEISKINDMTVNLIHHMNRVLRLITEDMKGQAFRYFRN